MVEMNIPSLLDTFDIPDVAAQLLVASGLIFPGAAAHRAEGRERHPWRRRPYALYPFLVPSFEDLAARSQV